MSNTSSRGSQDSKADVTTSTRGNGASLRRATVANWLPSQTDKAVRPLRKGLRSLASAASDLQYNSLGAEAGESKQVIENLFWISRAGLVVKFSVPIESSFQLFSICTCHEIVPPRPVPDAYRRIKERSAQISPPRARESAIQLVSGCSYSRFLGPEAQIRLEKLK